MRLLLGFLLFAQLAHAAGTVTCTHNPVQNNGRRQGTVIECTATADASDGSFPDTSLTMCGWFGKLETNPGGTAPTANYDIQLMSPIDSTHDALNSIGLNRHTSNTETAVGGRANGAGTYFMPIWLCSKRAHTLKISNNSVNSATTVIYLYLFDNL